MNQQKEINWLEFLPTLWSKKIFIGGITAGFTLLAILWTLSLPNQFTATALYQLTEEDTQSSLSSGAGNMASIAGVNLGVQSDTHYAEAVLQSRSFLKHLASFPGIRENVTAASSFDYDLKEIVYKKNIFNGETKEWAQKDSQGNFLIPSDAEVYEEIMSRLKMYVDYETQFIKIEFEHFSPIFAYEFLELLVAELNNIERKKDTQRSSKALIYLNSQLEQTRQTGVQNSISQLIESQLKTQMMANIDEHYLIQPIDPPVVPHAKSSPKRRNIVIFAFLFSLIGSCISILVRDSYFN